MKLLREYETVKLHYGKYLYKLKLYNQLASIFRTELQRDGKLAYAKNHLVSYNAKMSSGQVVRKGTFIDTIISKEELDDANHIFKVLRYTKNYMVRCEYNSLTIYSNNIKCLTRLYQGVQCCVPELWTPKENNADFLLKNKNVILVDTPAELPYKITFGRKRANPELASWLLANSDKSKAGATFIHNCETSGWIAGHYIYVRDEKVLFLINMIAGDNIIKVEELVYQNDINS